ncbi:EXS-domain-containing protein [Lojkania enalia]|uniref:EXS-domain-containing protein n=1 Tax=Lojkania enalia TaxID=147567 RepID=A0A9P4TQJ2_9PLEO|nr:EXS-domain-containing protein [Didymosphaeria enalia]
MPFGWGETSDSEDSYERVYNNDQFEEHKSSLGHEIIAGGAAFAGFKAFEDHQRREGKPVSHAFAKEMLAGFAAAEVDKLAETKGEDWFDREKAKREAKRNAEHMYDEHYVQGQGADQYDPNQYSRHERFDRRGWELERDCVPEWRSKYLNYKQGKKKLKAITRALRNANQTPRFRRRGTTTFTPPLFETAPKYSYVNRGAPGRDVDDGIPDDTERGEAISNGQATVQGTLNGSRSSLVREIRRSPEEQPLNAGQGQGFPGLTQYGSIIGTPPERKKAKAPPSLKLPQAALDADGLSNSLGPSEAAHTKSKSVQLPPAEHSAFEVGKTRTPQKQASSLPFRHKSIFSPKGINSTPGTPVAQTARPAWKRALSFSARGTPPASPGDVHLEAYRDLDIRQSEFFHFLDMELEKVEVFYKAKEDEATARLNALKEQLHIMRDRRLEETIAKQTAKIKTGETKKGILNGDLSNGQQLSSEDETRGKSKGHVLNSSWLNPVDAALEAVRAGKYGKSTKAMQDLGTPSEPRLHCRTDDQRDYIRRPDLPDVPYNTAKRKLKVALQEYYRGLELLKSYALLNRTAFRKMNKKYDKTVSARPPLRYMTEKVNKAWFVQSDVIEGHIRVVEDLYARYFERGNHKVAVGKLRIKIARAGDYTETSFRNGLFLAGGLVLGGQGLVYGSELLFSDDSSLATSTSYLLQIYAGYFLHAEYGTNRKSITSLYLNMIPATIWTGDNFLNNSVLSCESLILPESNVALEFNSLYPVEFRDFYLGDMFCSLTYTMGNIELFFCLYANEFGNPGQCNSTHSRLLGFFTTLPGIWRALQCIRRYKDTRNVFPHLVNCGKYTATILFYVTLSIYRLDRNTHTRATFIAFATINAIYCSIWDVFMDFSLGDPSAHHRYLRKTLGYKKIWIYYVAMIVDPILRFNWIPYAIFPFETQHSTVLSFVVALSETCRRGMWTIFRVENEHCTNVGRFRASRDVPLPYDIPSSPEISGGPSGDGVAQVADHKPQTPHPTVRHDPNALTPSTFALPEGYSTAADLEQQHTQSSTQSRRRREKSYGADESPFARGLNRVGSAMRDAHAQDFERRKKPELGRHQSILGKDIEDDSDDEDDEDDQSGHQTDEEEEEVRINLKVGAGGAA